MKCDEAEYYTVKETAMILKHVPQTIYNKLSRGESLPEHIRVGTKILFSGKAIIEFMKKNTIKG